MKIRTLIVDDEFLARERLRQLLQNEPEVEIVGECADGLEAVAAIRQLSPELVFLDIQMPELDGFGVLEAIRSEAMPVIVFVTAHDKHALRAFEVHAVDYLLKPFDRERFQTALRHALGQLKKREGNELIERLSALLAELKPTTKASERLAVKSGASVVFVNLEDIDWIEASRNYIELHVGKTSHLLRKTLEAVQPWFSPEKFVRINRSTIVNVERIKELQRRFYGDYLVTLQDGKQLILSRRYRCQLKQLSQDYAFARP